MNDSTFGRSSGGAVPRPVIVAIAVALLAAIGVGAWYYWRAATPAAPPAALPGPAGSAETQAEHIEHPAPPAPADVFAGPIPDLADSDKALLDSLDKAAAGAPLLQFLVPESIVRHVVVTIDNLARQKVAVDKMPVRPTPGNFLVDGDELHATIDKRNFHRYAPLVALISKIDTQRVAAVYLHFYPLFQQAYQDLGYPTGYFNDRLVAVIDLLVATRQVTAPIDLTRPNVLYVFADPQLEALPAGQKILIRMGPENAAVVKAKLLELRALVTAAAPKH
jgi:hypothetical protein